MGQAPTRRGGKSAAAGLAAPSLRTDAIPRRGRPKGTGIDDASTLALIADLMDADPDLKPTTAIKKAGVTDPSVVRRLREKLKAPPEAPPSRGTVRAAPVAPAVVKTVPPKSGKPVNAAGPGTTPSSPQTIALATALAEAVAERTQKLAATKPAKKAAPSRPVVAAGPAVATTQPAAPQTAPPAQPNPSAAPSPPQAQPQAGEQRESFSLPFMPAHGDQAGAAADILRAGVEAATAITRLQMEIFEQMLRLSPLTMMLKQQKSITQAMTAAMAAQRKPTPKK